METQTDRLARYYQTAADIQELGDNTDPESVRLRAIWTNQLAELAPPKTTPKRWQVIDNRGSVIFAGVHGRANAEATAEDLDWDQPTQAPHTIEELT